MYIIKTAFIEFPKPENIGIDRKIMIIQLLHEEIQYGHFDFVREDGMKPSKTQAVWACVSLRLPPGALNYPLLGFSPTCLLDLAPEVWVSS
jgi:hypothetical protein